MNQEKQCFSEAVCELKARKEMTNRKNYGSLIEEAETLLQKCTASEGMMDIENESLAELYFLTAELLFGNDLAVRAATHTKTLANEGKALEYYNKAIQLQDKEEYAYELWNFLSTAGHEAEGIAALESFIERTGGTAKVLSRAAEYILMYADSEDTETIQKSLDYFYRAIEKEPDRYETYWAYWTDLEEAVDVCPQLFKEALLCINKLIELSLPQTSENHSSLENRYFDLALIHIKMKEYEKALEAVNKGLSICEHSNYGIKLKIQILHNIIQSFSDEQKSDKAFAEPFFDLAHCYHITNQPAFAAKYYLSFGNARNIVPQKYQKEYLLYYKQYRQNKSPLGKIKKLFRNCFMHLTHMEEK